MIDGIDVSHWQGNINWGAVPDIYRWVAIKCSEGSGFKDSRFRQNFDGFRAAGKKVGAYHFHRANINTALQEQNFFDALGGRDPDFAVLDVESQDGADVHDLRNRVYWSLRFMEKLNVPVIVYTANWFWSSPLDGHILPKDPPNGTDDPKIIASGWPLWIADYGANDGSVPNREPRLPHGWRKKDGTITRDWSMWQYSSRGVVPGIAGSVDMNLMQPDFFELIAGDEQPVPVPVDLEARVEALELRVDNLVETLQSVT